MPRSCSVPGCKSNYYSTSTYVTTFAFPSDEAKKDMWLRAINREGFKITKHSAVCVKHFRESQVIVEDKMHRPDGTVLVVPRNIPKLMEGAYPTIIPKQPFLRKKQKQLLTKKKQVYQKKMQLTITKKQISTKKKRLSIKKKQLSIEKHDPQERRECQVFMYEFPFETRCPDDYIKSFDEFVKGLPTKNFSDFLYKVYSDFVLFYKLNEENCPYLVSSLKIYRDFSIAIHYNGSEVPSSNFDWILGKELTCAKWSMFETLVSHLNSFDPSASLEVEVKLEQVCAVIDDCATSLQ